MMHNERAVSQGLMNKMRHYRRMRNGHPLTGAVGVEDAQADRFDIPQRADGANIMLGGQFGYRVGRTWVGHGLFSNGLCAQIPINGARRRHHHAPHAHIAHRFHQANRPCNIDGVIFAWVENGFGHRDARCEMIDHIYALEQRPELGSVVNVATRKIYIRRESGFVARRQVINATHLMPLSGKVIG